MIKEHPNNLDEHTNANVLVVGILGVMFLVGIFFHHNLTTEDCVAPYCLAFHYNSIITSNISNNTQFQHGGISIKECHANILLVTEQNIC